MAKSTKAISLRVPEELIANLKKGEYSSYFVPALTIIKYIRSESLREIENVFSPNEWDFLASALCDKKIRGYLRCSKDTLVEACKVSEKFEGTATRYNINLPELIEKLNTLTCAQVEAIHSYAEEVYDDSDEIEE